MPTRAREREEERGLSGPCSRLHSLLLSVLLSDGIVNAVCIEKDCS